MFEWQALLRGSGSFVAPRAGSEEALEERAEPGQDPGLLLAVRATGRETWNGREPGLISTRSLHTSTGSAPAHHRVCGSEVHAENARV